MAARKLWSQKPNVLTEKTKKVLPENGKRNVLVTSALPYVNNVPHLGNIIGCVLSGDVFSRYCRLRDYQVLHVCGTDEYGTATEMKALKEKTTPAKICEKFFQLHRGIYEWFNIDFNHFGRTTTQNQTEICQHIFLKLHENGFTSVSSMEQLYCSTCSNFLADRYVFGTCPLCNYEDARGDQCDKCQKLLDAVNLKDPKCHVCQSTPVLKTSQHIFLDLDKLAGQTEKFLDSVIDVPESKWSSNAVSIARSWLKQGLEPRCITRDLKWGTPVPLEGFRDKVFYVWFDAPIGYMSITKTLLGDDWTKWWKDPNVELFQFVGKDNVAFHSIIFPATQIGTGEKYTMISHLSATEYLNYEDQKFSKSRGVGVFGDQAASTGIPADVWRFYLIYVRPEHQDTAFLWDDFALKVNSELLANLGNFALRALSFLENNFAGVMPKLEMTDADWELVEDVSKLLEQFVGQMEHVKMRDALQTVLAISRRGNQYIQANQPWVLVKNPETKERAGTVVGMGTNLAALLASCLYPFMPETSLKLSQQCGLTAPFMLPETFCQLLPTGHKIGKPAGLFTKLEQSKVIELKKQFGAAQESVPVAKPAKTPKDNSKKKMGKKTVFDELSENQGKIDALISESRGKLESLKKTFVGQELAKLEAEFSQLSTECSKVHAQLVGTENALGIRVVNVDLPKEVANEPKPKVAKSNGQPQAKPTAETAKTKQPKPEKPKKEAAPASNDVADVGRLDLRVGRIVDVKKHPDADSLYVETIDLGEDAPRTVVSGLVKHVPLEQMQNRLVVCLCNLKPAKMRGVESHAMVMCASSPEKVEIMEVPADARPGDVVKCPGFAHRPDPVLNPKKKVWETVAVDLMVDAEGRAVYKNVALVVADKGPMTAQSLRGVPVK